MRPTWMTIMVHKFSCFQGIKPASKSSSKLTDVCCISDCSEEGKCQSIAMQFKQKLEKIAILYGC